MGSTLRIAAVAVLAAVWGCFSAPSADVLFSCDPDDAPQCPPGYACESDGCCHRDGSDIEASRGACSSAGSAGIDPTATDGATETDPSSSSSSSSSGSGTEGSSGTESAPTSTGAEPTDTDTDTTGAATSGR